MTGFSIDHLVTILVAAVAGLMAWNWGLWREVQTIKLNVAENYVKHNHLEPIYRDLKYLRQLSLRIAHAMRIELPEDERD